MSVAVFGSINMDLVARTPRLPRPGETLTGSGFTTVPGGKGANQAVAVARLGVPTQIIGRVGNDSFGDELLSQLKQEGVNCDRVQRDVGSSGIAVIAVDDVGENHIILIPGANGRIDQSDVERFQEIVASVQVLLLQLEVPLATVQAVAAIAHKAGVITILDPAPAIDQLPPEVLQCVHLLTPNQTEAEKLSGISIQTLDDAERAASILRQRGIDQVVIKLGRQGALLKTEHSTIQIPPFQVEAIDTVAAGDAFNGAVAAALAEKQSLQDALTFGAAAGALATTKPGAQSSMPSRAELLAFLKHQLP